MISESELSYEDYSGELKKIELLDLDGDDIRELILLFDTKGGGGRGDHEIFVLWMDEEKHITAKAVNGRVTLADSNVIGANSDFQYDEIYFFQKVLYKGKECLQTRQYVWEGTHANWIGDLVSIVSLEKNGEALEAEVAWLELENNFPWD